MNKYSFQINHVNFKPSFTMIYQKIPRTKFFRIITLAAAHIKANYSIPYADCFAAATTKILQGLLVTGDPEFKLLQNYIDIRWI